MGSSSRLLLGGPPDSQLRLLRLVKKHSALFSRRFNLVYPLRWLGHMTKKIYVLRREIYSRKRKRRSTVVCLRASFVDVLWTCYVQVATSGAAWRTANNYSINVSSSTRLFSHLISRPILNSRARCAFLNKQCPRKNQEYLKGGLERFFKTKWVRIRVLISEQYWRGIRDRRLHPLGVKHWKVMQ